MKDIFFKLWHIFALCVICVRSVRTVFVIFLQFTIKMKAEDDEEVASKKTKKLITSCSCKMAVRDLGRLYPRTAQTFTIFKYIHVLYVST